MKKFKRSSLVLSVFAVLQVVWLLGELFWRKLYLTDIDISLLSVLAIAGLSCCLLGGAMARLAVLAYVVAFTVSFGLYWAPASTESSEYVSRVIAFSPVADGKAAAVPYFSADEPDYLTTRRLAVEFKLKRFPAPESGIIEIEL